MGTGHPFASRYQACESVLTGPISDDHAGLKAAREARFPGVGWQRCQFHLQQNAGPYVPRLEMRREVAADLRAVFESRDRLEADRRLRQAVDKYAPKAPKLSALMGRT